jgi:hypothetical protein
MGVARMTGAKSALYQSGNFGNLWPGLQLSATQLHKLSLGNIVNTTLFLSKLDSTALRK